MIRLILAAAIGCLVANAASAEGLRIHRSCVGRICTTTFLPADAQGLGKTVDVPIEFDEERDARIAKWHNFCEPKIVLDPLGVSRYIYSHKGCDTGRTE